SKGGLLVNNQSIPAWIARLFGGDLNWLSLNADLGAWRFLAFPVMIAGLAAGARRGDPRRVARGPRHLGSLSDVGRARARAHGRSAVVGGPTRRRGRGAVRGTRRRTRVDV